MFKHYNVKFLIIGLAIMLALGILYLPGLLTAINNRQNSGENLNGMTPDAMLKEKSITVDVFAADGSHTSHQLKTSANTLGAVLMESGLAEGEMASYGLFIHTVNGITANEANQEWWCITKGGGEPVMSGADSTPIADQEKYELTLMTGYS